MHNKIQSCTLKIGDDGKKYNFYFQNCIKYIDSKLYCKLLLLQFDINCYFSSA